MKPPTIYLTFALTAFIAASLHAQPSTIASDDRYAWGGNLGWVDFRPERPNPSDGFSFGEFACAGWLWAPNLGWINCGNGSPTNGVSYANTNGLDFGVNHSGTGDLSGLAWAANVGWINFGWWTPDNGNTNRPRVNLATGEFSGSAWSANCGWVNLGAGLLLTKSMAIPDTDGDGISDHFERSHAGGLNTMNSTSDLDGDGLTDLEEYIADSPPGVPNQPVQITRIDPVPGLPVIEIDWNSSPARIYGIEAKLDLAAPTWLHLGDVPGGPGTNTVQAFEYGVQPQGFLRVRAKLPFSP